MNQLIPAWHARRWSWTDLLDLFERIDSAPFPLEDPLPTEEKPTPLELLRQEAKEIGVEILDFRGLSRTKHYPFKEWGWFRDDVKGKNIPKRGRARGMREWSKVTGIMLHTAGVEGMRPKRFLGTPCHDAIGDDGTIVLCHPHNVKVWHGNAANSFTAGVEISGNSDLTALQAKAAKVLVRYIYRDIQFHHEHDMVMMGHVQSHPTKVRDPGPAIWQQVAMPMMDELGLKLGPVVGKGNPIPDHYWGEKAVA